MPGIDRKPIQSKTVNSKNRVKKAARLGRLADGKDEHSGSMLAAFAATSHGADGTEETQAAQREAVVKEAGADGSPFPPIQFIFEYPCLLPDGGQSSSTSLSTDPTPDLELPDGKSSISSGPRPTRRKRRQSDKSESISSPSKTRRLSNARDSRAYPQSVSRQIYPSQSKLYSAAVTSAHSVPPSSSSPTTAQLSLSLARDDFEERTGRSVPRMATCYSSSQTPPVPVVLNARGLCMSRSVRSDWDMRSAGSPSFRPAPSPQVITDFTRRREVYMSSVRADTARIHMLAARFTQLPTQSVPQELREAPARGSSTSTFSGWDGSVLDTHTGPASTPLNSKPSTTNRWSSSVGEDFSRRREAYMSSVRADTARIHMLAARFTQLPTSSVPQEPREAQARNSSTFTFSGRDGSVLGTHAGPAPPPPNRELLTTIRPPSKIEEEDSALASPSRAGSMSLVTEGFLSGSRNAALPSDTYASNGSAAWNSMWTSEEASVYGSQYTSRSAFFHTPYGSTTDIHASDGFYTRGNPFLGSQSAIQAHSPYEPVAAVSSRGDNFDGWRVEDAARRIAHPRPMAATANLATDLKPDNSIRRGDSLVADADWMAW